MLANHRKGKYGWGFVSDNDVDTAQSQWKWRGGWVKFSLERGSKGESESETTHLFHWFLGELPIK